MSRTPASVLVLSILTLVWNALLVVGLIAALVSMVFLSGRSSTSTAFGSDFLYRVYSITSLSISSILMAVGIACAIGSIRLAAWARKGMIVYAWASIVHALISAAISVAFVIPKTRLVTSATTMFLLTYGVVFVGLLIRLSLPGCIIYFYNRQHVKNAFLGIFPHLTSNFPVEFPNP